MKCFVTSVGEPTTKLCTWALERNGFDVILLESDTSLCRKLTDIYNGIDEDFLRIDADVIVNRKCTPDNIEQFSEFYPEAWWVQFQCWGWYSQDLIWGGVQYIKQEALPALRANVKAAGAYNRPETHLSRIKEFYDPRRFESREIPMGIHGYGIKDLKPIIKQKANRGQSANYDFELTKKLNLL